MWAVKKMRAENRKNSGGGGQAAAGARSGGGGGSASDLIVDVSDVAIAPAVNELVWVPDKEKVWRSARKVQGQEHLSPKESSSSADDTIVQFLLPGDSSPVEIPKKETHVYDPSHALDLDDASKMNQMHEAPLLDLLLRRFRQDIIYTNVADVLISVNPYKSIPLLYEVPLQQMQDGAGTGSEKSDEIFEVQSAISDNAGGMKDRHPAGWKRKLSKPHVFSVADKAVRCMVGAGRKRDNADSRRVDQSIIITGESGAGKTEAAKYVMRYLIVAFQQLAACQPEEARDDRPACGEGSTLATRIEDVLLTSTIILEAFGNAKTVRNDNSSRFGKYIKLLYDAKFRLVGARTEHFLLEKSRLVKVDRGERSYHIFYQLLAGLDPERAKGLHLRVAEGFHSICQGGCVTVSDEVDDGQEFKGTDEAMDTLGFTAEDKAAVFRVLAALLHLGNVVIEDVESPEQGQAKATMTIRSSGGGGTVGLKQVAGLLGLEEECLVKKVTWRSMITRNMSCHEIPLTAPEARDSLAALSKHTYGKLFSWIVDFINGCNKQQIQTDGKGLQQGVVFKGAGAASSGDGSTGKRLGQVDTEVKSFIGILDIFGFEIMGTNSFEQLCINFANEVLQRQFNNHIFVLELAEYASQGLEVKDISFRCNERIIDLISEKPLGLMIILEDQVLTGRKAHATNKLTDRKVLDLYHQEHHRRKPHPNYEKPRIECDQFILKHFAGRVTYDIVGFLEKNNDALQDDLRALLLDSKDPFVGHLAGTGGGDGLDSPPPPPGIGAKVSSTRRESRTSTDMRGEARLANKATVSSVFRRQLDDLVKQLGETEPHYIKCIKPNLAKAPRGWSSPLVIEQLRYSGVLEVVRIRREAYPEHIEFAEMLRRFHTLLIGHAARPAAVADNVPESKAKEYCREICLAGLEPKDFQIGKTKVFLKHHCTDKLRWAIHQRSVDSARAIQEYWRAYAQRVLIKSQAAIVIQARWRSFTQAKKFNQLLSERRKRLEEQKRVEAAGQARIASVVRGYTCRRRLARRASAATTLQASIRAYNSRKPVGRVSAEAELQGSTPADNSQELVRQASAATTVQVGVRAYNSRKLARRTSAATTLQTSVRAYNSRKVFALLAAERLESERKSSRAVQLQAWARMALAGQAHGRARRASTTIASAWRCKMAVMNLQGFLRQVTIVQAIARGVECRGQYSRDVARIVLAQRLVRGFTKRAYFRRMKPAALRMQICIRAWLSNLQLYRAAVGVFKAAREGNLCEVMRIVTGWQEILYVRDRFGARNSADAGIAAPPCYDTLLHAACQSGSLDMVVLLEPFPVDVTERDREGNTSLHLAALAADYEIVKYLAIRHNMDVGRELELDEQLQDLSKQLGRSQVSRGVNVLRSKRLERARWRSQRDGAGTSAVHAEGDGSNSGKTIMSGYLQKRRETDRWLKRWCVLTDTSLMYYHKQTDLHPSKILKLDKAMLKKSENVDFAFEIHTPELLDKKNKEGRLYFRSSGEKELQHWMIPLRMAVAHYQFRNDKRWEPMVYLDHDSRKALVRLTNKAGETPLHMAAQGRRRFDAMECTGGDRSYSSSLTASAIFGVGDGGDKTAEARVAASANVIEGGDESSDTGGMGMVGTSTKWQGRALDTQMVMSSTMSKKSYIVAVQRLAAWLVEAGADPNAVNKASDTPLDVAVEYGNTAAAAALVLRGGETTMQRKFDGQKSIEIAIGNDEIAKIVREHQELKVRLEDTRRPTHNLLLPPPFKAFGGTYASFFLEKTSLPPVDSADATRLSRSTGSIKWNMTGDGMFFESIKRRGRDQGNGAGREASGIGVGEEQQQQVQEEANLLYFVRITVYNGKGMLTEAQQDMVVPILARSDHLWWGQSWHMQTPLETLGPGSFVVFELVQQCTNARGERTPRTLCWAVYHLDPDEVNTRGESLSTYAAPVDPTLSHLQPSEYTFSGEAFFTQGMESSSEA